MYFELIYTRCRQGIDILKSGRPISSDGFKVYSCASSLMEGDDADLQFLFNAAQGKQSYDDPAFMDDAYLYFVPDKGDAFMVNFHPIPYDPTAKGDYSHRAGNFINQILVGDYSGFYPFELFKDVAVWNAKARGEAFYYENAPTALPSRNDIGDPVGKITIDDLAAFISDGRRDALMAAVSFLIAQYGLPSESRKFLVIRDVSSENIELWIAAIEHAFSPRIAASIPFATRLDKFATANRYTVNQLGVYQTQINLQDPNQKQRYRAMIVGVDERDRINVAAARPLANSPFVLLEGKEKHATFEADVSHRYYRLITAFDDAHQTFCRDFLQMLDINAPSPEIFRLYDIYTVLDNSASLPNAYRMAEMLAVLSNYRMFACSTSLRNLYSRVIDGLARFLRENIYSALQIIKWLQTVAQAVGDHTASERLTEILCEAFAEQVFRKSDANGTFGFWESIKKSEFASSVAIYIVAPKTLQNNRVQIKPSDYITFALIYIECATFMGTVDKQDMKTIVDDGLKFCYRENDVESALKILKALSHSRLITAQDMLFSVAREADKGYTEFLVKGLIETDESIIATCESMLTFFKKLGAENMGRLFISVLKYRPDALTRPAEIEQFVKQIKKIQPAQTVFLAEIFEALDARLVMGKKSANAALAIQQEKPKEARCPKSAHIYALEVLSDSRKRADFTSLYDALKLQGFPVETNQDYIRVLTEKLLKAQMTSKELDYVIQLFSSVPEYISELVGAILEITTPKRNNEWNVLITVAAKIRNQATDAAIIGECANLKKGKKALNQLNDMLKSRETLDYFARITDETKEIICLRKPRSAFGLKRLFGGVFTRDYSDNDNHLKKERQCSDDLGCDPQREEKSKWKV